MNNKIHSRKLSLLVAILILLTGVFLGGYLVLKSGRVSADQLDNILKGSAVDLKNCEPNASDAAKDSDSDGLKDWQEIQLYLSDACQTDSDGDGYLDGEEIASGYNPVIKAPGDELPGTAIKGPRPLPENLTKALSSMLSQQITAGRIESFTQNGQLLSATELEKYPALQQSVKQILLASGQLFTPETIDESQIKTSTDNSSTAVQQFAGQVKKAIYPEGQPPQSPVHEIDIFLAALETADFSALDVSLAQYQTAYQRLLRLTVPDKLLTLHLEQLNIFSTLIKIYENIKMADEDPFRASLTIQKYQETLNQQYDWINKLNQFIADNY